MKNKADMLLIMLLDELMPDTGTGFFNKNGENENFEVLQEVLRDEETKDKFYEVLLNTLGNTLKIKYDI